MYDAHVGVTVYYDGLGSTRSLTDISGSITDTYLYNAYGNVLDQSGNTTNNYLFTGEQFDALLDNYYLRARYYDPRVGRFTQMDSWMGEANDPITLHKYLYANGNPTCYTDQTGHFADKASLLKSIEIIGILAIIGYTAPPFSISHDPLFGYNVNATNELWNENSKYDKLSGTRISAQGQVGSPSGPEDPEDESDRAGPKLSESKTFTRGQKTFRLDQGSSKSGWKHIYDRHVDLNKFQMKSKFPTSASEADIINVLSKTVRHGAKSTYQGLEVYTFRTNYGNWGYRAYRATINSDGTIRTFHPLY